MSYKLNKYSKIILPVLKVIVLIITLPIITIIMKSIFALGVMIGSNARLIW